MMTLSLLPFLNFLSHAPAHVVAPRRSADAAAALAATRRVIVSWSKDAYDVGKSTYKFVKSYVCFVCAKCIVRCHPTGEGEGEG